MSSVDNKQLVFAFEMLGLIDKVERACIDDVHQVTYTLNLNYWSVVTDSFTFKSEKNYDECYDQIIKDFDYSVVPLECLRELAHYLVNGVTSGMHLDRFKSGKTYATFVIYNKPGFVILSKYHDHRYHWPCIIYETLLKNIKEFMASIDGINLDNVIQLWSQHKIYNVEICYNRYFSLISPLVELTYSVTVYDKPGVSMPDFDRKFTDKIQYPAGEHDDFIGYLNIIALRMHEKVKPFIN